MNKKIVGILLTVFTLPAVWGRGRLPEDRGTAGLAMSLRQLQTTGRLVYMIAHPDDEDGGTVTMLSRGKGYKVTFLALSRGEAAGDAVSSDFGPALGIRRTLEMVRSSEYYGAKLRMSRFLDFGLSKTLEKTRRYWSEEDAVRDMVRFIRQERPHVVVSRWQGNAGDRLGNHEFDGVVAWKAFEAAGDPARFPEQVAQGLAPWQPLKFYSDNRTESDDWTITVDSAVYDPIAGRTYAEMAQEGLGQQVSQAAAGSILPVGWPSVAYYKLIGSRVGPADKESDFFDRIDVSLGRYPELENEVVQAVKAFDPRHPEHLTPHLAQALRVVRHLLSTGNTNYDLTVKEQQLQSALAQALGLQFEVLVDPETPGRTSGEYKAIATRTTFTPGATFHVTANYRLLATAQVTVKDVRLFTPEGWTMSSLGKGRFEVHIPDHAVPTSAFWVRDSVQDGFYRMTRPELLGAPLPPAPLHAELTYMVAGVEAKLRSDVETSSISSTGVQLRHNFIVAPRVSVSFEPEAIAVPSGRSRQEVVCSVHNYVDGRNEGTVHLELPTGWTADPEVAHYSLETRDEEARLSFHLIPPLPFNGVETKIVAVAESNGQTYHNSFVPVTEADFDTVYMESLARLTLRSAQITIPKLRVGYIMGTGDKVPQALRLLGIDLDLLDSSTISSADLSKYETILLGVRTYLARDDLKTYNWRLLEYVRNGGVVIVQYNTEEFEGRYGPYPYKAAGAIQDVTEEDSPMEILEPQHPVFNFPNKIVLQDFEGWMEKRGLRFLASWDTRYIPLLSTHDVGQKPQAGGLLVGSYGKGLWVYNGYSLYRQIDFAVPGAVRLLINLASLGASNAPWRTTRSTSSVTTVHR